MARLRIEADDSLRDEIDLQSVEYSTEQIDNMSDAEFSDIFGDVSRESVGGTPLGAGTIYSGQGNDLSGAVTIYPDQGNDSLGVGLDEAFETVGLNRDIYEGVGTIIDMGQVGSPETDESVVGEVAIPVTIVQRNEAGEETGRVSGVRIGSGDSARVLTLEELASINQSRRRAGQDQILVSTPPFFPEIVDTSGAAVNDATSNTNTDADANDSNDNNMSTDNTTSGSIYDTSQDALAGTGGGTRLQIPLPGGGVLNIPEGKTVLGHAADLVRSGLLTAEVYNNLVNSGEYGFPNPGDIVTNTEILPPGAVDNTISVPEPEPDPVISSEPEAPVNPQEPANPVDVNTSLEGGDTTVTTGDTTLSGGDTTVSTGDTTLTGGDLYGGDVTTGDTTLTGGDVDVGETTVTTGDVTTEGGAGGSGGAGGAGGNVSVNIGTGDGLTAGEITEILKTGGITALLTSLSDRGEITPGQLQDIFPEAVSTIRSGAPREFAEEVIELDRDISPQQAKLATDLYGQITAAVRDSQNPLVQSLFDRGEMLDSSIAQYFDPNLSFLQQRDAEQQGFAEALAFGRPFSQADERAQRRIQDRRDLNFQLGLQGLGQQQNLAALTSDIEGGIYSQIAPNIGIDPNVLLNVSGTDIGNRLSLIQSTQGAEAIRDAGNKQLAAEFGAPIFSSLLDFGMSKFGRKSGATSTI